PTTGDGVPALVVPQPVPVTPGFMALIASVAADDYVATQPLARAQQLRVLLEQAGIPANLAPSAWVQLPGATWAVYVDGLASKTDAGAICAEAAAAAIRELRGQSCVSFEKGSLPRRSAGPATTVAGGPSSGRTPTT